MNGPSHLSYNLSAARMPQVGSRRVDAAIEASLAAGREVLPLRPYPERALPEHIVEAVARAAREQKIPPSAGFLALREAIAECIEKETGATVDPQTQILMTFGGMHALYLAFHSLLKPGDAVLAPAPCYFLEGIVEMARAVLVPVLMNESFGFRIDFDRLREVVNKRSRILFINTPANPAGYVLTEQELERITAFAVENNLIILADESYDAMVYDNRQHLSLYRIPEARDRTVLVRSLTKSFAMPSWRVGYLVAHPQLADTFLRLSEWMCLYGSGPIQSAALAALTGPRAWLSDIAEEFAKCRDCFFENVSAIPGITVRKPEGGPFLFPNVSRVSSREADFAHLLLREFGVPSVPGSLFHATGHLRIAFGANLEILREAASRIAVAALRHGNEVVPDMF
jgi:aspartate/methionine/tyrosine aminotransferase